MKAIVEVHFPGIKQRLVSEALKIFYEIREVPGMKKKPSTSELLDWLKLLPGRGDDPGDAAASAIRRSSSRRCTARS